MGGGLEAWGHGIWDPGFYSGLLIQRWMASGKASSLRRMGEHEGRARFAAMRSLYERMPVKDSAICNSISNGSSRYGGSLVKEINASMPGIRL